LAGNRKTCVLAGYACRWLADSRKISHQRGAWNTAVFLLPFAIVGGIMKKETAIKIITECAKAYHVNLENRNLMFIFGTAQKPAFLEAVFLPRNFLHLTGVSLSSKNPPRSSDFYEKSLKGRLSPDDFSIAADGTTEMKLLVLPQLMKIYQSAKMVGDYNSTKSLLYTGKLAGNVSACMGFVREDRYYIPNTALKEDIRNITLSPQQRVLAVFRKPISQPVYQDLCYTAKGISFSDLQIGEDLQSIIELPLFVQANTATVSPINQFNQIPDTRRKPHEKASLQERIATAQAQADQHNCATSDEQGYASPLDLEH
jgi:hypothetical protein